MYSMMACRTRQDLSSASSIIAGRRDSDRSSIPITKLWWRVRIWALMEDLWVSLDGTLVDSLKLADNIQPNFRELVLEEVQK